MSTGIFIPLPDVLAKKFPSLEEDPSPPHVTFLYIGDVPEDQQDRLQDILRHHIQSFHGPVTATLSGFDTFEHPDKVRTVAHCDVTFSKSLLQLRDRIREALTDAGIAVKDDFPIYHPHATLAYLPGLHAHYEGPVPRGSWDFHEFELWGLSKAPLSIPMGGETRTWPVRNASAFRVSRFYLYKTATKTPGEKEDEAVEGMVKSRPNVKPQREDLRRGTIPIEDPDLASGVEADPDLSLNYKTVAGRVTLSRRLAAMWIQAEGKDPTKDDQWESFWKSRYKGKTVPNPNPKTRESIPNISTDTALRNDKPFQQRVYGEYKKWLEEQKENKPSSKDTSSESPITTSLSEHGLRKFPENPPDVIQDRKDYESTTPEGSSILGVPAFGGRTDKAARNFVTGPLRESMANIIKEAIQAGKKVVLLSPNGVKGLAGSPQRELSDSLRKQFKDGITEDTWDDDDVSPIQWDGDDESIDTDSHVFKTLNKHFKDPDLVEAALYVNLNQMVHGRRVKTNPRIAKTLDDRGWNAKNQASLKEAFENDPQIHDILQAFNALRQENLVKKIKKIEASGAVAVASPDAKDAYMLKPVFGKLKDIQTNGEEAYTGPDPEHTIDIPESGEGDTEEESSEETPSEERRDTSGRVNYQPPTIPKAPPLQSSTFKEPENLEDAMKDLKAKVKDLKKAKAEHTKALNEQKKTSEEWLTNSLQALDASYQEADRRIGKDPQKLKEAQEELKKAQEDLKAKASASWKDSEKAIKDSDDQLKELESQMSSIQERAEFYKTSVSEDFERFKDPLTHLHTPTKVLDQTLRGINRLPSKQGYEIMQGIQEALSKLMEEHKKTGNSPDVMDAYQSYIEDDAPLPTPSKQMSPTEQKDLIQRTAESLYAHTQVFNPYAELGNEGMDEETVTNLNFQRFAKMTPKSREYYMEDIAERLEKEPESRNTPYLQATSDALFLSALAQDDEDIEMEEGDYPEATVQLRAVAKSILHQSGTDGLLQNKDAILSGGVGPGSEKMGDYLDSLDPSTFLHTIGYSEDSRDHPFGTLAEILQPDYCPGGGSIFDCENPLSDNEKKFVQGVLSRLFINSMGIAHIVKKEAPKAKNYRENDTSPTEPHGTTSVSPEQTMVGNVKDMLNEIIHSKEPITPEVQKEIEDKAVREQMVALNGMVPPSFTMPRIMVKEIAEGKISPNAPNAQADPPLLR